MSMTIQQAIRCLHLPGDHLRNYDEYGIYIDDELKEAMQMAMAALREKAEREDPIPLTYDELLQMDGEPVWLEVIDGSDHEVPHKSTWTQVWVWDQKSMSFLCFGNECNFTPKMENYGKTWLAYRHKPKEVSDNA